MPALFHHAETAYCDSGEGPAVVFAHTLGFDHRIWDAVIAEMPPGRRFLRYDLRGHGASGFPPAPYSMGALVRDAESLLDHLTIKDCVFVGSGLGGMVAQGLAVKRLDQIRALVLANTAPRISTKDRWTALIDRTRHNGLASEADLARNFSAGFCRMGDITPWRAMLDKRSLEGFLGCAAAIAGTDFYTTTASLRLPALVIAASEDAITPADMARELAALIPGAEFDLIRRSGHLPMIEQPKAFAASLNGFLDRIGHKRLA